MPGVRRRELSGVRATRVRERALYGQRALGVSVDIAPSNNPRHGGPASLHTLEVINMTISDMSP